MTTYWQKLKDPRWQRMRLEVLERDNFTCQSCRSKEKTLHVHHTYYEKGKSPWEYPAESLRTLCEDCHGAVGLKQMELARALSALDPYLIDQVIGYVKSIRAAWYDIDLDDFQYGELRAENGEQVCGVMDFFGLSLAHEMRYLDTQTGLMDVARLMKDSQEVKEDFRRALRDRGWAQ